MEAYAALICRYTFQGILGDCFYVLAVQYFLLEEIQGIMSDKAGHDEACLPFQFTDFENYFFIKKLMPHGIILFEQLQQKEK